MLQRNTFLFLSVYVFSLEVETQPGQKKNINQRCIFILQEICSLFVTFFKFYIIKYFIYDI